MAASARGFDPDDAKRFQTISTMDDERLQLQELRPVLEKYAAQDTVILKQVRYDC